MSGDPSIFDRPVGGVMFPELGTTEPLWAAIQKLTKRVEYLEEELQRTRRDLQQVRQNQIL